MTDRERKLAGPAHQITIEKAGLRVLVRTGTHMVPTPSGR
jgi:hypothetical protein